MAENWFSVAFANKEHSDSPAEKSKSVGIKGESEDEFARVLSGAVFAMRAQQSAWGNGESFGGYDLAETAARLVIIFAEKEMKDGFWKFESVAHMKSEGYADQFAKLESLLTAAKEFIKIRDTK